VYIRGNTIKKEIKVDKLGGEIHIKHSIMNDTTGIVWIVTIIGLIIVLIHLKFTDNIANVIPVIKDIKNPIIILRDELAIVIQNEISAINSNSLFNAEKGDTKSIS